MELRMVNFKVSQETRAKQETSRTKNGKRKRYSELSDHFVFEVCEEFFQGNGPSKIASLLVGREISLNREQVYPVLREARKRNFIELHPPMQQKLRDDIALRYPHGPGNIMVVNVGGKNAIQHVANTAAKLVLRIIHGSRKKRLQIGFGGGNTLKRLASSLSKLLPREKKLPHLVFHALGSGFATNDLSTCASVFFSFFDTLARRGLVECKNIFREPYMKWDDFEIFKNQNRKAFDEARNLDIAITTLCSARDRHGSLRKFMEIGPEEGRQVLEAARWIGDVLWRPFSRGGPITANTVIRPTTLLELDTLVDLAGQEDRHVILVAGPCATCRKSKAEALKAILTVKRLRMCNHLVIDAKTAKELLDDRSSEFDRVQLQPSNP